MHLARICPLGISRLFGHVQGTPALCAGCNMLSHSGSWFTPSACADWCLLPVCLRLVIAFCPCCILPSAFCLSCIILAAFCLTRVALCALPSAANRCLLPNLPSACHPAASHCLLLGLCAKAMASSCHLARLHSRCTKLVFMLSCCKVWFQVLNNCLTTEVILHSVCEPHTTMQASVRVCAHVCPSLAASTQAATRHWQQHDSCISRSAKLSEAAVPSTVTTRLPLPLVSFQKPLLQVLACIFEVRLLSACP